MNEIDFKFNLHVYNTTTHGDYLINEVLMETVVDTALRVKCYLNGDISINTTVHIEDETAICHKQ